MIRRLWVWWRQRPDIEDQPSLDPHERYEAWQDDMTEWRNKQPFHRKKANP